MIVPLRRPVRGFGLIAVMIAVSSSIETILHLSMFIFRFLAKRFNAGVVYITDSTVFIPNFTEVITRALHILIFTIHFFSCSTTLLAGRLHCIICNVSTIFSIKIILKFHLFTMKCILLSGFQGVET